MRKARKEDQRSRWNGRGRIGDGNKSEEIGSRKDGPDHEGPSDYIRPERYSYQSEHQLRMLLDIEMHLMMIQCSENGFRMWGEISMSVRKWYLDTADLWDDQLYEKQLLKDMDCSLRIMWESGDCVWLIGFELYDAGQVWFLENIRDIVQKYSPTTSKLYTLTQEDGCQLLATFYERLNQWQNRIESLERQYDKLKGMLKYWPQYHEVRKYYFGNNTCACYLW